MAFSSRSRGDAIQSLTSNPSEILVIGGGVVGCAIAARASELGLRCALLERADLACGASGNSTGLAHAGLRYLAQGHVLYVFHESRERQRLEDLAPQWVRPFDFILPVYKNEPYSFGMVRFGTWIYDLLARINAWSIHRHPPRSASVITLDSLVSRIPGLERRGLQGAVEYFVDAQLQDSRFTLGLAQKAARGGARVITYAEVQAIEPLSKKSFKVRFGDKVSGQHHEFSSSLIINATGAWIDGIRGLIGLKQPIVRASRGIHLIVDRIADFPLILSTEKKGKVFFVLPFGTDASLVGTTDTPTDSSPEDSLPQPEEIRELLQRLFKVFPYLKQGDNLAQAVDLYKQVHVRSLYWADRPLLRQPGSTLEASREHAIIKDQDYLWSVPGVKLTAGRAVGEEVAEKAWRVLRETKPPQISEKPLPGGDFSNYELLLRQAREECALGDGSEDIVCHLVSAYGTRYKEILAWIQKDSQYGERIVPEEPWILAEAAHAAEEELVETINDFLWRRTKWAHLREIPDPALQNICRVLANRLNWAPDKIETELAAYRAERQRHRV